MQTIMLQDLPTEVGQFDKEAEAHADYDLPVERLNPLFDFLHATLDRVQDVCEFLLACVFGFVNTWFFQFTSGLVAGLIFVSIVIWVVQGTIEMFYGQ